MLYVSKHINLLIFGKIDVLNSGICMQIYSQIINPIEKNQVCKFINTLNEISFFEKPTILNINSEIINFMLYNQFVKEFLLYNKHAVQIKQKFRDLDTCAKLNIIYENDTDTDTDYILIN